MAADWKPGDRVIVSLPDNLGWFGRKGAMRDFTGTVRHVNEPGVVEGVRVDLDQAVNGVTDCYATHRELRRVLDRFRGHQGGRVDAQDSDFVRA